jgi:hypothetical protein
MVMFMIRLRPVVFSVLALWLLAASSSHAACPLPHPKVCAEFYKSEAVVIGTVASEEVVDMGDVDGWVYRLNVTRVFRGAATDELSVFTENASARLPLRVGGTYLLFVHEYEGILEITSCGNSVPVSEAAEKIKELEEIAKASNGTIEGRVVSYLPAPRGGWKGLEAVRVVATGENGVYSVVTDRDGWFHITVPTGTYRARAEGPPPTVCLDLSYDDSDDLVIEKGGCGQLWFVGNAPPGIERSHDFKW